MKPCQNWTEVEELPGKCSVRLALAKHTTHDWKSILELSPFVSSYTDGQWWEEVSWPPQRLWIICTPSLKMNALDIDYETVKQQIQSFWTNGTPCIKLVCTRMHVCVCFFSQIILEWKLNHLCHPMHLHMMSTKPKALFSCLGGLIFKFQLWYQRFCWHPCDEFIASPAHFSVINVLLETKPISCLPFITAPLADAKR